MVALGSQKTNLNRLALHFIKLLQKESRRPLDKLSVIGSIVSIGMTLFLRQVGLSLFLYGLIFRRLSWLLVTAFLFGAILAAAFFFAMRPIWGGKQSPFASILTILAFSLLHVRYLVAGVLLTAAVVLHLILAVFLKALSST